MSQTVCTNNNCLELWIQCISTVSVVYTHTEGFLLFIVDRSYVQGGRTLLIKLIPQELHYFHFHPGPTDPGL